MNECLHVTLRDLNSGRSDVMVYRCVDCGENLVSFLLGQGANWKNWDKAMPIKELKRDYDKARQILVEICNVVGACTADVSLTFVAHLPGEVKARIDEEHQTAIDLFDVVAEIAALVGIERSEPEICRKTVTAVRELVEVRSREDCPKCGEENVLLPGDNFCPICGATIIWPGDREYR